ncbi:hypothetical protein HY212_03520 [Candidatus Pacearchaeota archaeon]|nr:hypothetical protein [Candidatus Pacearchaeota archaeon]
MTLDVAVSPKEGVQRAIYGIEACRGSGINTIGMLNIIRDNVLTPAFANTPTYTSVQALHDSELKSSERAASSSIDGVLNKLYSILGNP